MFVNDADYKYQLKEYFGYKDGKQMMKVIWTCPIFVAWRSMKTRCQERYQKKYPTYVGVDCCVDWKSFMSFHKWASENFKEGLELDKDILVKGNKIYSPETCAFVPKKLNYILNSFKSGISGTLPMGVSETNNIANKYRACISSEGKRRNLGAFPTAQQAHKAWQWAKSVEIEKAVAWYATQDCFRTDVADSLTQRVWQLRLEHSTNKETRGI